MQGGHAPGLSFSRVPGCVPGKTPAPPGSRGRAGPAPARPAPVGGSAPHPQPYGLQASPSPQMTLTNVHPDLEERGVGAGRQPRASGLRSGGKPGGWVQGSGGWIPVPAPASHTLPFLYLCPHPPSPLWLPSQRSLSRGIHSALHLPKAQRRSPPQRSDLGWGKAFPFALSHIPVSLICS